MASFLAVTGPKAELWLVDTVGLLLSAVGLVLIRASRQSILERSASYLGLMVALVLAGVDVVFVATETIPPIYLADAVAEGALVVTWAVLLIRARGTQVGERRLASLSNEDRFRIYRSRRAFSPRSDA